MNDQMTRNPLPHGLMIAAPVSGAGKTTLALGLLAAFRARGLTARRFTCRYRPVGTTRSFTE